MKREVYIRKINLDIKFCREWCLSYLSNFLRKGEGLTRMGKDGGGGSFIVVYRYIKF